MSETVHATAVLAGAHGVLIRGASGSGKSSLALDLIEAGARLLADDRVHLSACHGRLVATAPAETAGKLELRGRGILSVPRERSAVIRLVVECVAPQDLERMPADAQLTAELLGIALACQPVPGGSPRAALLVKWALRALAGSPNIGLR